MPALFTSTSRPPHAADHLLDHLLRRARRRRPSPGTRAARAPPARVSRPPGRLVGVGAVAVEGEGDPRALARANARPDRPPQAARAAGDQAALAGAARRHRHAPVMPAHASAAQRAQLPLRRRCARSRSAACVHELLPPSRGRARCSCTPARCCRRRSSCCRSTGRRARRRRSPRPCASGRRRPWPPARRRAAPRARDSARSPGNIASQQPVAGRAARGPPRRSPSPSIHSRSIASRSASSRRARRLEVEPVRQAVVERVPRDAAARTGSAARPAGSSSR